MHYIGMWALEVPGRVGWRPIVSSIRWRWASRSALPRWRPRCAATTRVEPCASLLLTPAIVSHHFTAMGAVEIVPDPARVISSFSISPGSLSIAIAGATVAVLGMSLIGALADRRMAVRAIEGATRFHALAEATTEAIAICEDGAIVDANTSLETLVGSSAAQLHGRPLQNILEDAAERIPVGGEPVEIGVRGAEGQPVECEASARDIPYRGRTRTIVSLRDLRERKRAEARIAHLAHHDR